MNLHSQKFKLFVDMCSSGADKPLNQFSQVRSLNLFPTALFVHSCVLPGSKNVHHPFCIVFRMDQSAILVLLESKIGVSDEFKR